MGEISVILLGGVSRSIVTSINHQNILFKRKKSFKSLQPFHHPA